MSDEWVINTPEDLAKIVDAADDQQLLEGMKALGVDAALEKVFEGMVQAFLPERAAGQSAVVQWELQTPEGIRHYHLTIGDGGCTWSRGVAQSARVTLALGAAEFLRIITGRLSGMTAFFQGKLKVSGDVLFAQTQENWFRKPS
jgi:putative sterol carrier protein